MKKEIKVDYDNLPQNIAIIMDGNGRWAKKRFLPKKSGHNAGAQALKKLSEDMNKLGFKYLTVYAFSTENWKRTDEEIFDLMNILREFIKRYVDEADKNNFRLRVIGDISKLDLDIQDSITYLENISKDKSGLCMVIAINYGGRDEIVRAMSKIAKAVSLGELSYKDINEETVNQYLDTKDISEPEIIIRTSGEMRLSNFLLWQSAYSELFFNNKLWPDYGINDLLEVVSQFQNRERLFGGKRM